jgi:hypothetical protein
VYHRTVCWQINIVDELGSWPQVHLAVETQFPVIFELRPFQKATIYPIRITGPHKGFGLDQIKEFLGHGSEISDRAICDQILSKLNTKFVLQVK